jgi:hypothetical protein
MLPPNGAQCFSLARDNDEVKLGASGDSGSCRCEKDVVGTGGGMGGEIAENGDGESLALVDQGKPNCPTRGGARPLEAAEINLNGRADRPNRDACVFIKAMPEPATPCSRGGEPWEFQRCFLRFGCKSGKPL